MKKRFYLVGLILVSCLLLINCSDTKTKSNQPFGDCQYGAPKAVFNKNISKITTHDFQLNKNSAVENIQFEGGMALELIQSGCEKPKQEFQFTIPNNTKSFSDEDWIQMGIDMFGFMGNLSTELQPFLMWQGALTERKARLKIGLPQELEAGFYVKMDKVSDATSGLLIVTLYQE